jgi:hypothetical protein
VDSPWNSLEVVKILIAFLTPLLLLGLGFVINRAGRRVEDAQWANRKLVEQRLEIYKEMAPKLNDLYCFFMVRGDFRNIDPPKALSLKRELDKSYHINRFLFSADFSWLYERFMVLAFETFTGVGRSARLRVDPETQRGEMGLILWKDEWEAMFSPVPERRTRDAIAAAHDEFLWRFAEELGVRSENERKAA